MKNLLIVCLILSSFSLFAQEKESKDEKKQRIEAAKVSFITKKLELTPEESKEFWPVVNEMEAEIKSSRKSLKEQFKKMKQEDAKIDEKTYQKLIEDMRPAAFYCLSTVPVREHCTGLSERGVIGTDLEHFVEEQFGAVVAMAEQ